MSVVIKVGCIASVAQAHMAVAAGADALGLVSAMPSGPGVIDDATVAAIAAAATPPPTRSLLLTARTSAEAIAEQHAAAGGRLAAGLRPPGAGGQGTGWHRPPPKMAR
jgi:phosphoribosylanthranilate isomerase